MIDTKDRNYPTQEDAEFMLKWMEFANTSLNGTTGRVKTPFIRADKHRMDAHIEVFGDKSPWSISTGLGRKREVYWDRDKARALGINSDERL